MEDKLSKVVEVFVGRIRKMENDYLRYEHPPSPTPPTHIVYWLASLKNNIAVFHLFIGSCGVCARAYKNIQHNFIEHLSMLEYLYM